MCYFFFPLVLQGGKAVLAPIVSLHSLIYDLLILLWLCKLYLFITLIGNSSLILFIKSHVCTSHTSVVVLCYL